MQDVETFTVDVGGHACRVWRKGKGPKLGFLPGFGGLPKWIPFLDQLAAEREVIVPSLPGFPGAEGHRSFDSHLDWILATKDLLDAAGLRGADLVASSVGAGLAAEVAALWPDSVRRLVLTSPFGLFDASLGQADPWAQRFDTYPGLLCAQKERFGALWAPPAGEDPIEWNILFARAAETSARIYFPLGDTRLIRRLPRITAPTLILWGDQDRVAPPRTAEMIAREIRAGKEICLIRGAGHLAELDRPDEVAKAVAAWVRHAA